MIPSEGTVRVVRSAEHLIRCSLPRQAVLYWSFLRYSGNTLGKKRKAFFLQDFSVHNLYVSVNNVALLQNSQNNKE